MIRRLVNLKHRFPGAWELVEQMNGGLFWLRYRNLKAPARNVLEKIDVAACRFSLMEKNDLPELQDMLSRQHEDQLKWFHPHGFDLQTLERKFKNPAFLMMKVTDPDGAVIGYFFLRCFFIGRAFAGLIVDAPWQNKGIGTAIWAACADICQKEGIRMQATIAKDNLPSIASCRKGTEAQPVANLEDGYLAVECRKKTLPRMTDDLSRRKAI